MVTTAADVDLLRDSRWSTRGVAGLPLGHELRALERADVLVPTALPDRMFYHVVGGVDSLLRRLEGDLSLINPTEWRTLGAALHPALERTARCLYSCHHARRERGSFQDVVVLNLDHSDTCTVFLYQLARVLSGEPGGAALADAVYGLNRMENACDLYHEVKLPEVFLCENPVGTTLGRAQYADHFAFTGGCIVGSSGGEYPTFEGPTVMQARSRVIGNGRIGRCTIIGVGATVRDQDVPSHCFVYGRSPHLVVRRLDEALFWKLSPFVVS